MLVQLTNRLEIEQFLRTDLGAHLYELGDLDDFFYPFTNYYGWKSPESNTLESIALTYTRGVPRVLISFERVTPLAQQLLLKQLSGQLSGSTYTHLPPGVIDVFSSEFHCEFHGDHQRMVLSDISKLNVNSYHSQTRKLTSHDLRLIKELLQVGYPNNFFNEEMLATDCYFGVILDNTLVGMAGVHSVSKRYRVAALGNVVVHPDYRGKSIAKSILTTLIQHLLPDMDCVGLNVETSNHGAIRCYEQLGFSKVCDYQEWLITRKS